MENSHHEAGGLWCAKNWWRRTKKLDSPGVALYHTPIQVCPRSVGAAGALKGQRGSFGRQPSLAPLHEALLMVCHIIVYFHAHVSIFFCVRTPADCSLAGAWIRSLEVRSLLMSC